MAGNRECAQPTATRITGAVTNIVMMALGFGTFSLSSYGGMCGGRYPRISSSYVVEK